MSSYKSYVPWSKRERESSYSSTKSDSSAQQNDANSYKPRTTSALGTNSFGRGTPTGSQLPSYRSGAYSAPGPANSARASSKDRTFPSYASGYAKKEREKPEERPTYKYGATPKDPEKSRLLVERNAATEETRSKSPLSGSRNSLLEKYSNLREPSVKSSDRPTSVLEKYTRGTSREKSREPDVVPRFVSSTYPGTTSSRTYTGDRTDKKERGEHPPVSYRGIRAPGGRSSREPSPEIIATGKGAGNCYRAYSRAPSYGRTTSGSLVTPESSSTPVASSRYSGAGTRFGLSSRSSTEHLPTAISYSGSDRYRAPSSRRSMTPLKSDVAPRTAVSIRAESGARKIENDTKTREKTDPVDRHSTNDKNDEEDDDDDDDDEEEEDSDGVVTLTVITRGTSPSAPAASSFVRTRRADTARMIQKEITRPKKRPEMKDEAMQSDRMDDTARFSRFGGGRVAATPWTSYLEKYSPGSSSSSGYVSRGYSAGSGASSVSRIGTFGFSRPSDSPTPSRCDSGINRTLSPGVSQETHGSISKVPSDSGAKVQSSELPRPSSIGKTNCRNDPAHSAPNPNVLRGGFTAKSREESPAKTDGSGSGSHSDHRSESINEDERQKISVPKIDGINQRISSVPKLEGLVGSRSESKLAKSSSRNDYPVARSESAGQRRSSTPKFDAVPLKYDERRENTPSKKEGSQPRRESLSKSDSGSSQSKISLSRNSSGKNVSRQISRADSSDGAVNVPNGRSKSSSASSMASLGGKVRSTPPPSAGKCASTNIRQVTPVDGAGARGKPPVPKSDGSSTTKSNSSSGKYVNKDFRKSALNMETGEMSRSKLERKRLKKQRSVSISSQDSQSEANSESVHQVASSGSSTSVKSNQSGSKLKQPSSLSKGLIQRVGTPPQRTSPVAGSNIEAKNVRSFSNSPSRRRKNISRSASSSSESTSSSSSSSTDEEDLEHRSNSRRRRRRASGSPVDKRCRSSAGSSRTSILASSADELSLAAERPSLNPKSRSEASAKTEEAKSFLMRALAPVTNLFKVKHQDSGELRAGWLDSTTEVSETGKKGGSHGMSLSKSITQSLSKSLSFTNSEKSEKRRKAHKLTHQVSGEKAWWMEANTDNVPDGVEKITVHSDEVSQDTTVSSALPDDGKFKLKIWRQDSGDKSWWLDANENIPEDVVRKESSPKSPLLSRRGSSRSSAKSDRRNRIKHQQSGERAWWMSEDPESVPEGVEVIPVPARSLTPLQDPENTENFHPDNGFPNTISKIRHIDSGEKAWWMDSSANVPEGIEKIQADTSISNSDSSESMENVEIGNVTRTEVQLRRSLSRFPIEFPPPPPDEPLGDRASPEGVENPPDPPDSYGGRSNSPYDNVKPMVQVQSPPRRSPPRKRPSTLPLFIGNHTNIDDLLGAATTPRHSPSFVSRIGRKDRDEESSEDSSECEEIDADQVIIHDSTPQIPVIRRRNRDSDRPQPDGYIPVSNLR